MLCILLSSACGHGQRGVPTAGPVCWAWWLPHCAGLRPSIFNAVEFGVGFEFDLGLNTVVLSWGCQHTEVSTHHNVCRQRNQKGDEAVDL